MAPRSAFDADLGAAQGRITPAGWTPPEGSYAFVLGSDLPGIVRRVGAGDSVQIAQAVDLYLVGLVRVRVKLRPPTLALPAGVSWHFVGSIDADRIFDRPVDRAHDLFDVALPTGWYGNAFGICSVTFALELQGPPGVYTVELPGVYLDLAVDDLVLADPSILLFPDPTYTNRDPEPGDTGVPLAHSVSALLSEYSGFDAVDPSSVDVTIGGVTAMAGGVVQAGFSGSLVLLPGTSDTSDYLLTLTPATPWSSLAVIHVQISASTSTTSASSAWSFTTADTVAPEVVDALALDPLTVRVTFDEAVTGVADASLYTLTVVGPLPAVLPAVASAAAESPTTVLLTLDRYATRGAVYRVTVGAGVTDLAGNPVTAPNDRAIFTGYTWPVPAGRDVALFKLLPDAVQAADETGEHQRYFACLQELVDIFFGLLDAFPQIYDPDTAPEAFVDLMLAELGNPFELALTLTEKRRLVQLLVPIYQTKGTGPGIVAAIRLFTGIDVTLRVYAWSPYPIGQAMIGQTFVLGSGIESDLYTFQVLIGVFLTAEQRTVIREILDVMRVAHEHYVLLEPVPVMVISHWQLGFSLLGTQTIVH